MGNFNPRPPTTRAAVFWRLCLFSLPLLAAWGAAEWLLAALPNSLAQRRDEIRKLGSEVDTLILGPSTGYYGLAPRYLSGSAFNLAGLAQSIYYDDRLLTQLRPTLPRLRKVIIGVHYISLYFVLHDASAVGEYRYYQAWGIPPQRWRDRFDIRMWSGLALETPQFSLQQFRDAVKRLRRGQPFRPCQREETEERGWWSVNPKYPPDLTAAEGKHALSQHHKLMHASNLPGNIAKLDHLLASLASHHIETVLIALPAWHTYRDEMRADYWRNSEWHFRTLAQKHGARYVSFLDTPQLQPDDFIDLQHLSPPGAVRFTKLLNATLAGTPSADAPIK